MSTLDQNLQKKKKIMSSWSFHNKTPLTVDDHGGDAGAPYSGTPMFFAYTAFSSTPILTTHPPSKIPQATHKHLLLWAVQKPSPCGKAPKARHVSGVGMCDFSFKYWNACDPRMPALRCLPFVRELEHLLKSTSAPNNLQQAHQEHLPEIYK